MFCYVVYNISLLNMPLSTVILLLCSTRTTKHRCIMYLIGNSFVSSAKTSSLGAASRLWHQGIAASNLIGVFIENQSLCRLHYRLIYHGTIEVFATRTPPPLLPPTSFCFLCSLLYRWLRVGKQLMQVNKCKTLVSQFSAMGLRETT